MDRPFLAFHIHSGHVPGHLHLLGRQHFRGSENSRSKHCRILKKSSSCTAHARLLEFSMLQTAIFADKSSELVRHSFRVHAILLGKQTSPRVARSPCSQFSGGTAQIRRTPVDIGAELLRKSCGPPKWRLESVAPAADFSKSTARNLPACSLKRDSKEDAPPRGVELKTIAGISPEPQFRSARNDQLIFRIRIVLGILLLRYAGRQPASTSPRRCAQKRPCLNRRNHASLSQQIGRAHV